MGGGGVPEMLARLKQGDRSSSPRWERFAMRLLVGHLLAYSIPGREQEVSRRNHLGFIYLYLGFV